MLLHNLGAHSRRRVNAFAYRYEVAFPGYRAGLNRYGWRVIGAYVVVGPWAYCLKWWSL